MNFPGQARVLPAQNRCLQGKSDMTDQRPSRFTFQHFATSVAESVGSSHSFSIAVIIILAWAVSGHFFKYSDTWQLWINTGTTIVTFLMVFLIQYTQNRDARAMHQKLNELLRAVEGARTEMADLKDLSDEDMEHLERSFDRLAHFARRRRAGLSAAANESGKIQPATHAKPPAPVG
jgi:low affinity Fe/Cu permease